MHGFPTACICDEVFEDPLYAHTHAHMHYWQAAVWLSPTCHAICPWNASLARQIKGRMLPVESRAEHVCISDLKKKKSCSSQVHQPCDSNGDKTALKNIYQTK